MDQLKDKPAASNTDRAQLEAFSNNNKPAVVKGVKSEWFNFFTDNGLPVPLIRHRGRGDLVATIVVLFSLVTASLLLFGGSSYVNASVGLSIKIPTLDSFGKAAVAVVSVMGALFGYVRKRAQDKGPTA